MAIHDSVKDRILKERDIKKNADQIAKLKVALENGILSEVEYEAKVTALKTK